MAKKSYILTVDFDGDYYHDGVKEYIEDAVSSWSKGGDPASPLWDIEVIAVKPVLGVDKDDLLREVYKQLKPKTTNAARRLKELL